MSEMVINNTRYSDCKLITNRFISELSTIGGNLTGDIKSKVDPSMKNYLNHS